MYVTLAHSAGSAAFLEVVSYLAGHSDLCAARLSGTWTTLSSGHQDLATSMVAGRTINPKTCVISWEHRVRDGLSKR